jgi:septum formation protein
VKSVILASSSPQRSQILRSLNIPFRVIVPDCEEILPPDTDPCFASEFFAVQKIESVLSRFQPDSRFPWVLASDTAIVFNAKLYGKPRDAREAASFLHDFSGNTQTVYNSIVLYNGMRQSRTVRTAKTDVVFKTLSDNEIAWYIQTAEWRGAAGGYRLQGNGACFISRISGSPSGVTGLSVSDLYDIMKEQDYFSFE